MTDDKTITETDFGEVDREALNRALQVSLNGVNREHAQQVRERLSELGWWEAASTSVYHQQIEALGLKPWERPPCEFDTGNGRVERDCDHAPVKLLKRMLAHGLSKWEPDPINSINAIMGKRK